MKTFKKIIEFQIICSLNRCFKNFIFFFFIKYHNLINNKMFEDCTINVLQVTTK